MNCREIEPLLFANRDRALAPVEQERLQAHLADCPACRHSQAMLALATDAWRRHDAAVPTPDPTREWQRLRRRLHESDSRAGSPRWRPLLAWSAIPLAAAATLLIVLRGTPPADPGANPTKIAALPATPPATATPPAMASAEYVEAADPGASTLVYVDQKSGWLVVWASDSTG